MFDDGSNNQWSGSPDGAVNERNDMRTKLKLKRISLNISQGEMAKRLGLTKQAYYKFEKGTTFGKMETWENIQTILGFSDDEMWEIIKGER